MTTKKKCLSRSIVVIGLNIINMSFFLRTRIKLFRGIMPLKHCLLPSTALYRFNSIIKINASFETDRVLSFAFLTFIQPAVAAARHYRISTSKIKSSITFLDLLDLPFFFLL